MVEQYGTNSAEKMLQFLFGDTMKAGASIVNN